MQMNHTGGLKGFVNGLYRRKRVCEMKMISCMLDFMVKSYIPDFSSSFGTR